MTDSNTTFEQTAGSPDRGACLEHCFVYFGGSYRECWSENYTLSVLYEGRRSVRAEYRDERWTAVSGDEELVSQLRSPDCPPVMEAYFQTAATVSRAVQNCRDRGMGLEHLGECFQTDEALAAPELLRCLMDDCGFSLNDAYYVVADCCRDLWCTGIDAGQIYPLQPRTAHVISILRSCRANTLAVKHVSTEPRFRSPVGAVPAGTQVRFAFQLLGGRVERATLMLYGDTLAKEYPMEQQGEYYAVTVPMPEEPAALWYLFQIETPGSSHWLCPGGSGFRGRLYGYVAAGFRQTVYEKDFETPAWFRRRVMYQIFPDRFAFSHDGTAEKGLAYHQLLGQTTELHRSLDEPVRWQPRPFERDYSPDDFYGGTLKGIEQNLPYLRKLGVTCLYLNPIVEARSNHRYDTSDYRKVDPILGSNEDFEHLCRSAASLGIRVILDGVFSHTGADSIYFNRYGNYPDKGACQGQDSPYYNWYDFRHFPDDYRCWWGFQDLPEVEETNPVWQEYIISGADSVVKTWLRRGASGWRLDVADELPDEVLSLIRRAAKEEKPDALVLGEVWEDAVIKESYGGRRNYALGFSLDSVMNYPLRRALLDFIHQRIDACGLRDFLVGQQMNYPKPLYYSLMNLLGSHDVERIRNALATPQTIKDLSREDQLKLPFSEESLEHALVLERLCAIVQFAIPGVPSIYYGDEQGMCGVNDPFNRQVFRRDRRDLFAFYAQLAGSRNAAPALSVGQVSFQVANRDVLLILRWITDGKDVFGLPAENGVYLAVVNRSGFAADYEADCRDAGCGFIRGTIGPWGGEIRKLL